jgi:hypothetical protein
MKTKPNTTFDKVLRAYSADDLKNKKLTFGICSVRSIVTTLRRFTPYLVEAHDCFFVENERGPALVTCVSEFGVRILYFAGRSKGKQEWLHYVKGAIIGDSGYTTEKMVKQP